MTIINNSIFRTCSRRPAAYEYMTRDYVSVQEGASVREAMRSLVRQAGEQENVSTIYVVAAAGTLTLVALLSMAVKLAVPVVLWAVFR